MTPHYPDEYEPDSYEAGVRMGWRLAFSYLGFSDPDDKALDREYLAKA